MREIKFRVWNGQRMFHPCDPKCDTAIFFYEWGFDVISHFTGENKSIVSSSQNKEVVLMQFTGLKDKNGKDIYEGDIFGNVQLRCVVVREDDGAYKLHFVDKRIKPISILDHKIKASKIVGNIHTNPELINK